MKVLLSSISICLLTIMNIFGKSNTPANMNESEFMSLQGQWRLGSCEAADLIDTMVAIGSGGSVQMVSLEEDRFRNVSQLYLGGRISGIGHYNDFLIIANRFAGLKVVDISDPSRPISILQDSVGGHASDIAIFEHFAYLAQGDSGITIYDIASPGRPRLIQTILVATKTLSIDFTTRILSTTSDSQNVNLYSLENPTSPERLSSIEFNSNINQATLSGSLLLVGTNDEGLRIISIDDPRNPQELSFFQSGQDRTISAERIDE